MTGDWRRLALAALAATAVAVACVSSAGAQAPAKTAAKKAPAKEADAERAEDGDDAAKKTAKKKRQDPVEAQRAIEGAMKLLETGKPEPAAQALTAVLAGGNLPPAIMAKALLYRGIAYRQQHKPAQAIADLTSAMWLKGGLGEADRADALKQRTSAYQEAGLADTSGPIAPPVPSGPRATRTASASESVESPEPPKQSSGGWGNPFAGWFGGASQAPVSPPPQPQPQPAPATTSSIGAFPPPAPAAAAPAPATKTSAWSSNTEVRADPAPVAASPVAASPVATSPPAAKPVATSVAAIARTEGRFRIQIGMVRTQAEAQALVARVKREHAATLATHEAEIDEATVGNMGSFYRVRLGPFASAPEGQTACAKLKGTGIDCLVVTQ